MKRHKQFATSLVVVVATGLLQTAAQAAFVAWTIDDMQSTLSLAIPDQKIVVDGNDVTIRVRNQSGGTSWTVGNTAPITGLLHTNYSEVGSHSIEFLPAPAGVMTGVNTGSYRPDPAAFDTNTQTYTNTSSAAAVFGARLPTVLLIGTFDAAHIALRGVSYNMTSGSLPVSGVSGGTFAASGTALGVFASTLGVDGLTILGDQPLGDSLGSFTHSATNKLPTGTITDLGGPNRQITIPVSIPFLLGVDGNLLVGTATGQIVATALVPEPSGLTMIGITGLALCALAALRRR